MIEDSQDESLLVTPSPSLLVSEGRPAAVQGAGAHRLRAAPETRQCGIRHHFGEEAIIGVSLTSLAHECLMTVQVRRRTQPMMELAKELEWDEPSLGLIPLHLITGVAGCCQIVWAIRAATTTGNNVVGCQPAIP